MVRVCSEGAARVYGEEGEINLWLMVYRERADSREDEAAIKGLRFLFRDRFGDRDGLWRARAYEGMRAEMTCVRGSRRILEHRGTLCI